jgi:hypothetical protein
MEIVVSRGNAGAPTNAQSSRTNCRHSTGELQSENDGNGRVAEPARIGASGRRYRAQLLAPGTILVALSQTGVEVQPAGQLLYYPVLPPSPTLDTAIFAEANKLQFQAGDLKAAASILSALAANKDPRIRADALLRLASVQSKSGQTKEALATYEMLGGERLMHTTEAPYGFLARVERSKLLASSRQESAARGEALTVLAGLESGRWPLSKG